MALNNDEDNDGTRSPLKGVVKMGIVTIAATLVTVVMSHKHGLGCIGSLTHIQVTCPPTWGM